MTSCAAGRVATKDEGAVVALPRQPGLIAERRLAAVRARPMMLAQRTGERVSVQVPPD